MRTFIIECWNAVMDNQLNPLSKIPDLAVRHMIMQILAWMWCIIFSFYVGSWLVFGISAVAHLILIAGICITVATFKTAKRERFTGGYGRAAGGEHE